MLQIEGRKVEINHFPDGALLLRQPYTMFENPTIKWHFENNEELFAVLCLAEHFHRLGLKSELYMPYIPNARQDRVKEEADVFTLKYFSTLINNACFESVTVLDPHSYVSEALFNNLIVRSPKNYIEAAIAQIDNPELILFYPDEGAMNRYSGMIQKPYAFGIKRRDWKTGNILGLDVAGDTKGIRGKQVLIVDDICSRGGTFYFSARKLKELGADKIFLYVTHCESTIFYGEIFKSGLIDRVFTTDSIFVEESQKRAECVGVSDKITVFKL